MLIVHYLSAFGIGFGLTLVGTPLVSRLARLAGAMDRPNPRKVHKVPTPLWGGLAVFVSYLVAVLAIVWGSEEFRSQFSPRLLDNLYGMLLGSAMIVGIGMIDDRFGMPAKVKLLGQILTGIVMFRWGIRIDYLSYQHGILYLSTWQAFALSLFWIVGITNAINLLDGLDGLVAGVALGSSLVFLVVGAVKGQWLVVLAMAALAGCALAFLRYNFNPAQIFMGDTGSLFIGLNFAGWSVIGLLKATTAVALVIPVLIMAVPILDTTFAIVRRSLSRRPIFAPDKGHLHHRLLGLGMSQRQAVILIYAINMIFGLAGLALACALQ